MISVKTARVVQRLAQQEGCAPDSRKVVGFEPFSTLKPVCVNPFLHGFPPGAVVFLPQPHTSGCSKWMNELCILFICLA